MYKQLSNYLEKELHDAHDVLMCIGTKHYINDKNRIKFSSNHYFKNDNAIIPSPSSPPVDPAKGHFGDPEIK